MTYVTSSYLTTAIEMDFNELPKRDELLFLVVLAFPNASRIGLALSIFFSKEPA